jgi:hypothetical protein
MAVLQRECGTFVQPLKKPPRKLAANSNKYNFSQYVSRMENGNNCISSEEHFKNSKTRRRFLFLTRNVDFCPNI